VEQARIKKIAQELLKTYGTDIDAFEDEDSYCVRDCDCDIDCNIDELLNNTTMTSEEVNNDDEDEDDIVDKIRQEAECLYKNMLINEINNSLSQEEQKMFVMRSYCGQNNNVIFVKEFVMPNDAIIVATWNNQSPNCLSRNDYHYVDRTLFYFEGEYYVAENKYVDHPVQSCSVRSDYLIDLGDADLNDKTWDIDDVKLWNKLINKPNVQGGLV